MKTFFLFLITFCAFSDATAQEKIKISLEQVIEIISQKNYLVQSKAMNVYQAKENIALARGNLLPHLHLWSFVGVPLAITNLPGVVEDVLPFLVPNNWLRVDEQKILAKAEFEGYRTLWANEVSMTRAIFLQIRKDMALLETIQNAMELLRQCLAIAEIKEKFGGAFLGVANDIRMRVLSLEVDIVDLKTFIHIETGQLAYLLGFSKETELELLDPTLVDLEKANPIEQNPVIERSVEVSTEIIQLNFLIEASKIIESEPWWAFLGLPQSSRGNEGSVFGSLPVQRGLGFGTVPSVHISKAQTAILETVQVAIRELQRDKVVEVVDRYNALVTNYPKNKERVELAQGRMTQLMTRIKMGGLSIDPLTLIEASRNLVASRSAYVDAKYRFMIEKDKLNRLTLQAEYDRLPDDSDLIAKQKMADR
jgi:hypothetical protein